MCGHWLCQSGDKGLCYFVPDPHKPPVGAARDLTDLEWDLLDELHDAVIADPTSRRAASILGVQIESCARRVSHFDPVAGEKCCEAMAARYAGKPDPANPRLARKVVLLRGDDADVAAEKVRRLGDDFVARLLAALGSD